MSTIDPEWSMVTVLMRVDGDRRTMMYASHRDCGWVPPLPCTSSGERMVQCSTCGAKLNEKMDRMIRLHNFVMKIGD